MIDIEDIATRAYYMAEKREAAILQTMHGPIVVSTNSRDYERAAAERVIGVYNASASYRWIVDDLTEYLNGFIK